MAPYLRISGSGGLAQVSSTAFSEFVLLDSITDEVNFYTAVRTCYAAAVETLSAGLANSLLARQFRRQTDGARPVASYCWGHWRAHLSGNFAAPMQCIRRFGH